MSLLSIPPAPEVLTGSDERLIDLFQFQRAHPYVVSDGRRFMTLEAAADTAYGMKGSTVTDADGTVYTWDTCRAIAGRGRRMNA